MLHLKFRNCLLLQQNYLILTDSICGDPDGHGADLSQLVLLRGYSLVVTATMPWREEEQETGHRIESRHKKWPRV